MRILAKIDGELQTLLWHIVDKANMICAIFEAHEYPELEAMPVVEELRKLLDEDSVHQFMAWARSSLIFTISGAAVPWDSPSRGRTGPPARSV